MILLPLLLVVPLIYAYPSAPGTCNMNKMSTIGHGPSQSTCDDCYGVQITTERNRVKMQLTGRFAYQGIVLLVKDTHTNKTLGEFQDFDTNLFTSVACDDDEDEQDRIEADTIAVLGHIDSKLKNWPVNIGWNMNPTQPVTELKLQGMIVIDYDNFHLLPETEFKLKRKILKTATTTVDSIPTTVKNEAIAEKTVIEVEHEAGTFVQQESNTLFIWVLSIFISIYFLLSTCYRQLSKKGSKRKHLASLDEISLVPSTIVTNASKDY